MRRENLSNKLGSSISSTFQKSSIPKRSSADGHSFEVITKSYTSNLISVVAVRNGAFSVVKIVKSYVAKSIKDIEHSLHNRFLLGNTTHSVSKTGHSKVYTLATRAKIRS